MHVHFLYNLTDLWWPGFNWTIFLLVYYTALENGAVVNLINSPTDSDKLLSISFVMVSRMLSAIYPGN